MSVLAQRFSKQFTAICNNMGGLSLSDGSLLPFPIPSSNNINLNSFIPVTRDTEIYNKILDIWKNEKWETLANSIQFQNNNNQESKKNNNNHATDSFSVVLEENSRRIHIGGYSFIPCLRPKELLSLTQRVPLLIITGTKDTMRDHCHFAYQMFLNCNYPVTLVEILEAEHEWFLDKEEDIYEFFMYYRG